MFLTLKSWFEELIILILKFSWDYNLGQPASGFATDCTNDVDGVTEAQVSQWSEPRKILFMGKHNNCCIA